MSALEQSELLRIAANKQLDPKRKSKLGQFYTPAPICQYMASLFDDISGKISVLDPGCGVGSLTSAFVDEAAKRGKTSQVTANCYDLEGMLEPFIQQTFDACREVLNSTVFSGSFLLQDYILTTAKQLTDGMFHDASPSFSHIIMNPPYKKISSSSEHRKALTAAGIETVNLYTGFVALALKQLNVDGEIVVIIPRSFCNGTYYQPFRKLLFTSTALRHIHIFESRKDAFAEGDVLQENIILHCVKGAKQGRVTVSSSSTADFSLQVDGRIEASGMKYHEAEFDELVKPTDKQHFLHIPTGKEDHDVREQIGLFNHKLTELGLEISTGPVVDFRLKDDLVMEYQRGESVPLLYPSHFNGKLNWPLESKRANAIRVSDATKPWLWKNEGCFVITRRLTSKEEKRRIVAYFYDGSLPEEWIGFDNKLNVFHSRKKGLDEFTARGLCLFLNSSLIDRYYRSLGGHTQVNAGDLRSFGYPDIETLKEWGAVYEDKMPQSAIDRIIEGTIAELTILA